jgi:hypothetical protein
VDDFPDSLPDGLIEGVGKELELCPSQSQGSMPIRPASGHWIFQFNHAEPNKVVVLVSVVFAPPYSSIAELRAEMNESQIRTLGDWLGRILKEMHERPKKR